MKYSILFGVMVIISVTVALPAQALSCLPVDMYLEEVVGKEEVVIFTGAAKKQRKENLYTAEVVTVSKVLQGYVEKEIFVYHEKDETWGYLCNNGPKEINEEGTYIAVRDALGTYNVTQRLATDEPAVSTLISKLKDAQVTGEVVELSATDRMNQIITTIMDLFVQIGKLLQEYAYWKGQ